MQKEIIEQIKKEQARLKKSLNEENSELKFFNSFLQRIDFAKINTYNNVSIEELIMAYVKSTDSYFSLEELQEIAEDIVPIFNRCTSDEIHSLLALIDDFATAENYIEIMDVLYSDSKQSALEDLIEDAKGDLEQDYVEPAARIMQKDENEKLIDFIEVFHTNPNAWGYALLLVHVFYQIKEDQEERKRNQYQNLATMFPIIPKQVTEDDYDISAIKEVAKTISIYQNQLKRDQRKEHKVKKKEIENYNRIIAVLNRESEEITDYRTLLTNISNPSLRLEILKEIYRKNNIYYKNQETRYKELVENSEAGYESLCQEYQVKTINPEELMARYSYKELEGILSILKDLGIYDVSTAIKNTSLKTVKDIVELIKKGEIGIEVVRATPDIWNSDNNYSQRIRTNADTIKKITGSSELYKTRSGVNLMDSESLKRNLTILKNYNLLDGLHTTTSYQFLQQDKLKEKIDLILELGKEEELTHNLGLLNYSNIRWKRLLILEALNLPVEEANLEGILHTDHFLVPDDKLKEYIETSELPDDIIINPEEVKETARTYIYRGISFSKNKVRENYLQNEKTANGYIDFLPSGRQFTPKEISTMREKYIK